MPPEKTVTLKTLSAVSFAAIEPLLVMPPAPPPTPKTATLLTAMP